MRSLKGISTLPQYVLIPVANEHVQCPLNLFPALIERHVSRNLRISFSKQFEGLFLKRLKPTDVHAVPLESCCYYLFSELFYALLYEVAQAEHQYRGSALYGAGEYGAGPGKSTVLSLEGFAEHCFCRCGNAGVVSSQQ